MKIICIIFALICAFPVHADEYITIDTVYSFTPGTGQNAGQSSEYFPANIFGLPYENADSLVPAVSPNDLLSLGMNGEIVVGFKDYEIVDGEGDDFYIYENVMFKQMFNKLFVEPAKVAVSQDGDKWIECPFDSLTLEGCAGVHPTLKAEDLTNFRQRGGDGFDLKTIGLDRIKYIKITDISEIVKNNKSHPYYDVTISGFDLDAVVGYNFEMRSSGVEDNFVCINSPEQILAENFGKVIIYDILGNVVFNGIINNNLNLAGGLYYVKTGNKIYKLML